MEPGVPVARSAPNALASDPGAIPAALAFADEITVATCSIATYRNGLLKMDKVPRPGD